MSDFKMNDLEVDVWDSGSAYPVWVHIKQNGKEITLSHREIRHLELMLKAAKRAAIDALPPQYKNEV
jgi:hypothetical protein